MSTMIKDPKASTPTSGRGSGTLSGAAQGAAAGTAVMPGVGTVVGAVVGGVAGWLGGSEQDKAAKHATLAFKYAQLVKKREAAVVRRDMLRQFRAARAMSMVGVTSEEGGKRSSAPQGGISSLGSQFAFNQNYFDANAYLQEQLQKHSNKAGKHAQAANTIMATTTAVMSSVGSMAGAWGKPTAPPSAPTVGGGPVSSTPLGSNTYGGGNWGSFYPTNGTF